MKINKLLVTAVLAFAIGAAIKGIVGDIGMSQSQPTTSTGVKVPFLHGFSNSQSASQSESASIERANASVSYTHLTLPTKRIV